EPPSSSLTKPTDLELALPASLALPEVVKDEERVEPSPSRPRDNDDQDGEGKGKGKGKQEGEREVGPNEGTRASDKGKGKATDRSKDGRRETTGRSGSGSGTSTRPDDARSGLLENLPNGTTAGTAPGPSKPTLSDPSMATRTNMAKRTSTSRATTKPVSKATASAASQRVKTTDRLNKLVDEVKERGDDDNDDDDGRSSRERDEDEDGDEDDEPEFGFELLKQRRGDGKGAAGSKARHGAEAVVKKFDETRRGGSRTSKVREVQEAIEQEEEHGMEQDNDEDEAGRGAVLPPSNQEVALFRDASESSELDEVPGDEARRAGPRSRIAVAEQVRDEARRIGKGKAKASVKAVEMHDDEDDEDGDSTLEYFQRRTESSRGEADGKSKVRAKERENAQTKSKAKSETSVKRKRKEDEDEDEDGSEAEEEATWSRVGSGTRNGKRKRKGTGVDKSSSKKEVDRHVTKSNTHKPPTKPRRLTLQQKRAIEEKRIAEQEEDELASDVDLDLDLGVASTSTGSAARGAVAERSTSKNATSNRSSKKQPGRSAVGEASGDMPSEESGPPAKRLKLAANASQARVPNVVKKKNADLVAEASLKAKSQPRPDGKKRARKDPTSSDDESETGTSGSEAESDEVESDEPISRAKSGKKTAPRASTSQSKRSATPAASATRSTAVKKAAPKATKATAMRRSTTSTAFQAKDVNSRRSSRRSGSGREAGVEKDDSEELKPGMIGWVQVRGMTGRGWPCLILDIVDLGKEEAIDYVLFPGKGRYAKLEIMSHALSENLVEIRRPPMETLGVLDRPLRSELDVAVKQAADAKFVKAFFKKGRNALAEEDE
ncbi:hypothetical protein JCM10212_000156, partial [Sporobolomyces blumeae]